MSRLTEKDYKEWVYVVGTTINQKASEHLNYINHKLGELEDLEDELGCPLNVVFKALKEGIIDEENEDRDIMIVHSKQGYWFREFSEDLPKLWVKDYKKTWWLKEDLSECTTLEK